MGVWVCLAYRQIDYMRLTTIPPEGLDSCRLGRSTGLKSQ